MAAASSPYEKMASTAGPLAPVAGSGAATAFREAGVPCHVLTTFPVLLDVARRQHSLSADAEALLNDWQADPEAWSHEHGG